MYDVIIVGAGTAGCVLARELAEKKNKKVLVIEQKNHIAGNCYDVEDEHGVLVHPYGPHIFHTSSERVYTYLSRFTKWRHFRHTVVANVHGKLMPVPFNLHTLEEAFPEEKERLKEKLVAYYGMNAKVPILDLMNHEDEDLQKIGQYVYDNIYVYYTMKQWGKKPEEIDPAVTARVPVNISYDDGYFGDTYQGLPQDGFTPMFKSILDHSNITLKLKTEAKDIIQIKEKRVYYQNKLFEGQMVFTGPLDEFFDCQYGRLPYRTLRFDFVHFKQTDFQGHSVINYTVDKEYTRITEYKRLTGQICEGTTISKEYPFAYSGAVGEIPYYAIASRENHELYEKYKEDVAGIKEFYLLGRLAEYQYYNIDTMVEKALDLSEKMK